MGDTSNYRFKPVRTLIEKMKKHHVVRPSNYRRIAAIFLKLLPGMIFRNREQRKYRQEIESLYRRTDPVIVIGHWRSGTSYLQYLLSRDKQFAWHDKYQGLFPDIYLSTSNSLRPGAERFLNMFRAVSEWKKNISVDMDLDSPIEIESAYVNEGLPTTYHWGHVFPKAWEEYSRKFLFMEDIEEEELQAWKKAMTFACKKIRYRDSDRRVLIKNPGDTARLEHILALYPDAKFIFIHRNPYDVFYSNKKLWRGILKSISLHRLEESETEELILNTYENLMRKYLEKRSLVPEDQLLEVALSELNDAPRATMKDIYEKLDLGSFEDVEQDIMRFVRTPNNRRISGYQYRERDMKRINRKWGFAFDEWNYEMRLSEKMKYEWV